MPQTRHISKEQPLATSSKGQHRFEFPANHHLLITTPSHICAWDSKGTQTIFRSSKNGIVAAREAQDGSGMLAVADTHVVVLHDTKRGHEKSWGLNAGDDEIRHLEYAIDGKALFLSTSLTADIQRYSTWSSRLLSPERAHASPPVALAVSSTGHLMVSASDKPPVIYLKNLAHNSSPVLIEPRASKSAVSTASFHPERPNIFLLAFRDGTIAAYDATRLMRSPGGTVSNQESVNRTEISHLAALHRATSTTARRAAITGAAFLPGFKTRAVSVGSDGRCRIIDFADGGVVLRTWHAKAPVTSVSVLSVKPGTEARNRSAGSTASHIIGGPTSTNDVIAIGRTDGEVHLYDSVGLLLSQQGLGESGERIISVEWVKGLSPKPIVGSTIARAATDLPHVASGKGNAQDQTVDPEIGSSPTAESSTNARRDTLFEHVGLPPGLRKPKEQLQSPSMAPPRKFTIHPDEVEESTIRHTPVKQGYNAIAVPKGEYLDLFSPVKSPKAKAGNGPEKRVASPPRPRPALTPQTFIKSPEPIASGQDDTMSRRRNLALFPSTDSASDTVMAAQTRTDGNATQSRENLKISPSAQKKRITFKTNSRRASRRSSAFKTAPVLPNNNARVLAELRKMSGTHPAGKSGGVLSEFASNNTSQGKVGSAAEIKENKSRFFHRVKDHVETDLDSENARKAYEEAHVRHHWPQDSNQDSSLDGDIWLTSDSCDDTKHATRRKQRHIQRPPARQTSRSRVTSKGTMSTIAQQNTDVKPVAAQPSHRMDGSTEEEMFTADTHVTSSGTFSPSSKDVRELFPRSSSLSPRKRRRPEKQPKRAPTVRDGNLQEVAANEAAGRQTKSPWARAKAHAGLKKPTRKTSTQPIAVFQDSAFDIDGQQEIDDQPHCSVCSPTKVKVQTLEAEVARLKGEILVFKAVLRRQGVPTPAHLRQR